MQRKNRIKKISQLVVGSSAIFLGTFSSPPAMAADFKPQYQIRANDSSKLYRLARENAWMQEFFQSNLYRGLSLKLSPALTTIADTKSDTWQGRLLDFLVEKIASNRPVSINYYHRSGLVSPIGLRLEGLTETEQALLKPVIKQLRNGKDDAVSIARGTEALSGTVTPIVIQQQKFALILKGGCLSLSRDPKIVTDLSDRCPRGNQKSGNLDEVSVAIDLSEVAPSFYPFVTKFAGIGRNAKIHMTWNESQKRFDAKSLGIDLPGSNKIFRSETLPGALAEALPADTFILAAFNVPRPENYTAEKVAKFLSSDLQGLKAKPNLKFAIAAIPTPDKVDTVIILSEKEPGGAQLEELRDLFSNDIVEFKKLCGGLIAVSPSAAALNRMSEACDKKMPTLANQPQAVRDHLLSAPVSAGIFLNLADISTRALNEGWGNTDQPPEMKRTESLLSKLPRFSFSGTAATNRLDLSGVQQ